LETLGDRMKGYEKVWCHVLPNRMPVMARIDGISFSTLTRKMQKPHDETFHDGMVAAATEVMKSSGGAVLAYTQSDEITVLLKNDQTFGTSPFLGNRVDKLVSHLSGFATSAFVQQTGWKARFDCRVWVNPVEEVLNQFLWRQRDAFKNCISSVVLHYLQEKHGNKKAMALVHGKTSNERQEILFQETGINFNDYPSKYRRGSCIVKEEYEKNGAKRSRWVEDTDIPLFSQSPEYIEDRYLLRGEFSVEEKEEPKKAKAPKTTH